MESQGIDALLALCRTGSPEEQCRVIVDLEAMGAREAVPVLLGLSSSPSKAVRANVASALGKLGSCEAVLPTLLSLLEDPETLVRVTAIESLGELRCGECTARLMSVLAADLDPLVRLQAAETLGTLKERAASLSLISALRDPDEGVRAQAAEALGQLGERGVMPELRAQLAVEQSPLARASLLSALYQLGDEAALALLLDGVEGMDDQTAATVLGMAADVTRPQHTALLRSRLETLVRSRQALAAEARSLLRKAPGSTSE
jgi:HEAT repeat protein